MQIQQEEGMKFLDKDYSTSWNLILNEAFANFGFLGVLIVMFVLGIFVRILTNLFSINNFNNFESFIGIYICSKTFFRTTLIFSFWWITFCNNISLYNNYSIFCNCKKYYKMKKNIHLFFRRPSKKIHFSIENFYRDIFKNFKNKK